MIHNKFVTINVEGEDKNIGVIDLGDLGDVHHEDLPSVMRVRTEDLLVKALAKHFECPVKVRVPSIIKSHHPIKIEYVLVLETQEEDKQETVLLNEIQIYSK